MKPRRVYNSESGADKQSSDLHQKYYSPIIVYIYKKNRLFIIAVLRVDQLISIFIGKHDILMELILHYGRKLNYVESSS